LKAFAFKISSVKSDPCGSLTGPIGEDLLVP